MDWQTIIAGIIGFAAFALLGRWLYRISTGRDRGGCAGCDDSDCPLRNRPSRNRKSACPNDPKKNDDTEIACRRKNRSNDF